MVGATKTRRQRRMTQKYTNKKSQQKQWRNMLWNQGSIKNNTTVENKTTAVAI